MALKPPYKKGEGGRPKGARDRISRAFLNDLLDGYKKHGNETIRIMRMERPAEYAKLVASLLLKEEAPDLNINVRRIIPGVPRAGDDENGNHRPGTFSTAPALPALENKSFESELERSVPFLKPEREPEPAPVIELRTATPPTKKETDFEKPLDYLPSGVA